MSSCLLHPQKRTKTTVSKRQSHFYRLSSKRFSAFVQTEFYLKNRSIHIIVHVIRKADSCCQFTRSTTDNYGGWGPRHWNTRKALLTLLLLATVLAQKHAHTLSLFMTRSAVLHDLEYSALIMLHECPSLEKVRSDSWSVFAFTACTGSQSPQAQEWARGVQRNAPCAPVPTPRRDLHNHQPPPQSYQENVL